MSCCENFINRDLNRRLFKHYGKVSETLVLKIKLPIKKVLAGKPRKKGFLWISLWTIPSNGFVKGSVCVKFGESLYLSSKQTHTNLYKYKQIVFLGCGVFKMNFQRVQRVDACH